MTDTEKLRQKNLKLGEELKPEVRWAYEMWVNECFSQNLIFKVTETFRTQGRQNDLYMIGRRNKKLPNGKPEEKVTWTMYSLHTQRLAADVYPQNCTHAQLAAVAAQFGITHPFPIDPPHYQFDEVGPEPIKQEVKPEARLKGLERRLRLESDPNLREMLARMVNRLRDRLGISPISF